MSRVSIELEWWPPDPEEPIGEERAKELVAALRQVIGPVLEATEADLREQIGPEPQIVRGPAPVSYLAKRRFAPELQALCLGTVYEGHNGNARKNSIQLLRDGRVTWWRGGGS